MFVVLSRVSIARVLIVAGVVFAGMSCGGGDGPVAPDNTITGVRIDPVSTPLRLGATMQLHATATNAASSPVAGEITFSSDDPTILEVSSAGFVRAVHVGLASVSAHVAQVSSSTPLAVIAGFPVVLTKSAGDNGSATVQTPLAVAPAVTLSDSAGNPVAGVAVTFSVASGGGSLASLTATSNASGIATAGSWTMGATPGPNTLTASVTGAAGVLNALFTATALPLVPAQLAVSSTTATGVAGLPFTNAFVVEIRTAAGTLVPSATSAIAVTSSGSNRVVGTTTVNAVGGIARFTSIVPFDAGTQVLTFSSPGLSSATLSVDVAQGAVLSAQPVTFAVVRGDYTPEGQLTTVTNSGVGGAISGLAVAPITYAPTDSAWLNVRLLSTSTQANLLIEPNLTFLLPGTHVAHVTITGTNAVPVTVLVTAVITPLAPTTLVLTAPMQDGVRGALLTVQPTIELRDSLGLLAMQATDTVAVTIRNGPGYLSGTTKLAAVGGVARFTDLKLNAPGTFILAFSTSTALPVVTSRQFVITDAPGILYTTFPVTATSGVRLSPQPVVTEQDQNGVPLPWFGRVEISLQGLGGAKGTISGTVTISSSNGTFTFTDLVITGTRGDYLLIATDAFAFGPTSVLIHLQ